MTGTSIIWALRLLGLAVLLTKVNAGPVDPTPESTKPLPVEGDDVAISPEDEIETNEMMLIEWIPYPINKYRFITINAFKSIVEQGQITLNEVTPENFPKVKLVLSCVPGDIDYMYLPNNVTIISVDILRDISALKTYEDAISALHGFTYKVELWAHFMMHPDAFSQVHAYLIKGYTEYIMSGGSDKTPVPDEPTTPEPIGQVPPEDFASILL